jgi:hypothetical protein
MLHAFASENADADLSARNADDTGENDRGLITSDIKNWALGQTRAVRTSTS